MSAPPQKLKNLKTVLFGKNLVTIDTAVRSLRVAYCGINNDSLIGFLY